MSKKIRKLTKTEKIQFWQEVECSGLESWCLNYNGYFKGTEFEAVALQAHEALKKLNKLWHESEELMGDE